MSEYKYITNRRGQLVKVMESGDMESTRHKVNDAIDEINYEWKKAGKKEKTSEQIVGDSPASRFIRKSYLITNNPLAKGGFK